MVGQEGRALFVGFRATPAEAEKLDRLARRTRRSKSDVLRTLLDQARATGRPDLILEEEGTHG